MAKRSTRKKTVGHGISIQVTVIQRQPFWFKDDWLGGLVLLLAVILTYQPVWYAGFIWDDDSLLTANPCIVGPLGLKEIWTTSAADICPLTQTTLWAEHALWGLAPLPYHLVNVVLHGVSALLLWRVLRLLQVPGAWLGAALWALHPVQVDSVAWISEMKNTQSCLFYLLTILFFLSWLSVRAIDGSSRGGWSYALTLLFAALAMASKSSTVILPLVLCLCAWWVEGRWQWRTLSKVAPIFLLSTAAGVVSMWTQKLQSIHDPQWARSWPERLVTAGDSVWFYLGKLLWPHPLITIYPQWDIDAGLWFSYLPLLAVIVVLFIFWIKRKSWSRPYFFTWTYFLIALLPVMGLLNMSFFRHSFVADHFQYLAGMGPLALVGAGMARWADFALPKRLWLKQTLGAGVLLVLGLSSWQRAWIYENEETLWTDTLARNPNSWAAHNNIGKALLQKGQVDAAMAEFQKTLEINSSYGEAHYNLGVAFMQSGQVDLAVTEYQKALQINPDFAEAHYNLGNALSQKGQVDQAMAQFQKALQIKPDFAEAHNNLGNALLQKGQVDEAIIQFQQALEIKPNFPEAHNSLGVVFLRKGQVDAAAAQFQKALEIAPTYSIAQDNLTRALARAQPAPGSK